MATPSHTSSKVSWNSDTIAAKDRCHDRRAPEMMHREAILSDLVDELPWAESPVWRSVDCGRGWWPLIRALDERLRQLAPGYRVTQVKEKFGSLRYYIAPLPEPRATQDAVATVIRETEQQSRAVCEVCGSSGSTRVRNGWHKTLCDRHNKLFQSGIPGWKLSEPEQ